MFQEELTFGNIRNNLHGLAPSATSRSLRDFKSISLWSFFASIPQCISRDLAILTAATNIIKLNHHLEQFANYHYHKWALWELKPTWIMCDMAWSSVDALLLKKLQNYFRGIPLFLVMSLSQEAGKHFISYFTQALLVRLHCFQSLFLNYAYQSKNGVDALHSSSARWSMIYLAFIGIT